MSSVVPVHTAVIVQSEQSNLFCFVNSSTKFKCNTNSIVPVTCTFCCHTLALLLVAVDCSTSAFPFYSGVLEYTQYSFVSKPDCFSVKSLPPQSITTSSSTYPSNDPLAPSRSGKLATMDFNTETERLQIFADTNGLSMPGSPENNNGAPESTSLAYIEPSWDSPEPVASSNLVTMEPLTPLTPSQGSVHTPLQPTSDPVDEQSQDNQEFPLEEPDCTTCPSKMGTSDNDVNYVAALAASLLAEVVPTETPLGTDDEQAGQGELFAPRHVTEEKSPSTSPYNGNSHLSDEWSMILDNPHPPALCNTNQFTQPPASDEFTRTAAALDPSYLLTSIGQGPESYIERKAQCAESKKVKLKRGTLTRPRKLSKREAAKAATAAALAEELRLAHLAKTKQITDDELLRLKPKKKRRAAKFDKPVPSRFCHVCSRTPKSVRLAVCSKIKFGTCRKVICEKCFDSYGYGDFEMAKITNETDWLCPHCNDNCPPRAQCRTYQRINDRLRISRLKQERPRGRSSRSSRHSHVRRDSCDATDDDGICAAGSDHGSNSGTNTAIQGDEVPVVEEDEYMQDAIPAPNNNPTVSITVPVEMQTSLTEDPMQLAVGFENVNDTQTPFDMPPLGDFISSLTKPDGEHDPDTRSENSAPRYSSDRHEQLGQEFVKSESDPYDQNSGNAFENKEIVSEVVSSVTHATEHLRNQQWNGFSLGPLNDHGREYNNLNQGGHVNYQPMSNKGILNSLFDIGDIDNIGENGIGHTADEVDPNDSAKNQVFEADLEKCYAVNPEDGMECKIAAAAEVDRNYGNKCVFEEADCFETLGTL